MNTEEDHDPPEQSLLDEANQRRLQTAERRHTVTFGAVEVDLDVPREIEEDKDLALLEDDQFLQAKGEDVVVWLPVRRIHSHPRQSCAIMCGLWILSIIVLTFLSATIGSIIFDIGVPFYDRSEINQEREDAYLATQRDADYIATIFSNVDGTSPCIHEAPTILTRNGTLVQGPAPSDNCQLASIQHLKILYVASDRESNILTPENLEQIRKIELEFLSHIDLTKYCHLIDSYEPNFETRDVEEILDILSTAQNDTDFTYTACSRISSALNFMDELYFNQDNGLGYYLIDKDVLPQEYDLSQTNIDDVVKYWSNYTEQTFDVSDFPVAVQQVGNEITVGNLFYSVVSSDFQQGSSEAVGLMSVYNLGLPINGYTSSSQGTEDQHSDVGTWLWEEYDSFLKNAGFPGVDVFFNDSEGTMLDAETGYLAIRSFMLFPASLLFVLFYLMYMQDSIYIGLVGVMQIVLCFVPSLVLYRYLFSIEYLGVLNLIAVYIILGIGVDDLFVFCDQWAHNYSEKRFDQRLQKTFNVASRAMFTTSCTTFISFISNAGSVFPAVATFGIFSALLVLVNFCAITLFFPTAFGVYFKFIRHKWYDHPSRIICCNREPWTKDIYQQSDQGTDRQMEKGEQKHQTNADSSEESADNAIVEKPQDSEDADGGSSLVHFFEYTWAPLVIKFRYVLVAIFTGILIAAIILASQLEPDESPPNTLPEDNVYFQYSDILINHFARAGNPENIEVRWVGGINPDTPIDREGTKTTNITDYGTAIYVGCDTWNPSTLEAQVWNLQTCQDMFFGNVTEYHGGSSDFANDGKFGPKARLMVTERVPQTEAWYRQLVSCPHQGFRDWLLTDYGCGVLQEYGLECHNETITRPDCVTWDTNGNSCEPYPVPSSDWPDLFAEFMQDPNGDPSTGQTNYGKYSTQIFAAEVPELDEKQRDKILTEDFTCRMGEDLVLLSSSTAATLDQTFKQNYEEGIALYDLWDEWSIQMRNAGPREAKATVQSSNGIWSYYFLNETLINETFASIALALGLSFLVLAIVGGNPIMAFLSVVTIFFIVIDVFAFTVLMGWKLGVLEAINYVVVIGLSVDYTVHLSEAYTESHARDRRGRVTGMLAEMGVSVLSGAVSTLGAVFFMFFAPNTFFVKFAGFIFATIALSCLYSLLFFPAALSIIGPTGDVGNVYFWIGKRWREYKHNTSLAYIKSEEFQRRELAHQIKKSHIENIEQLSKAEFSADMDA